MSYFVLGCPSCSKALQVSLYRKTMEVFGCVSCGASIRLNGSHSLELSDAPIADIFSQLRSEDPLVELMVDAAGYGAALHERCERGSTFGVSAAAEEWVKSQSNVRQQMREWLKSYRETNHANPSRGELVPGGLAMIYGLVDCPEFNSMIVTLYVFCREGVPHAHPLLPDKRICLNPGDGDGWAVTGESVHAGDPTDNLDLGWGFFDEKNLMPINPEPGPLQVNHEEQQEQKA